jgi:osomolarity two-component system response regulator SKN7
MLFWAQPFTDRSLQNDGFQAVEKMRHNAFDMVLMDIILPNLNGCEATHYVRCAGDKTTPIIAMTSNIRNDDISVYFTNGK